FFSFEIWQEDRYRLLHHASALHHLRQKHLPRTEKIADDIHASHERTFNNAERRLVFLPRFFHILLQKFRDSVDEGVREPFLNRTLPPSVFLCSGGPAFLHGLREIQQPLGRVRPPIQQHVFDALAQL